MATITAITNRMAATMIMIGTMMAAIILEGSWLLAPTEPTEGRGAIEGPTRRLGTREGTVEVEPEFHGWVESNMNSSTKEHFTHFNSSKCFVATVCTNSFQHFNDGQCEYFLHFYCSAG